MIRNSDFFRRDSSCLVAQCLPIFCVWSEVSVTAKLDDPIYRNVDLV
jgi:hypothetical protein